MSDPVTLLHGDCLEVMRELPAESVDAVVTDPPSSIHFMSKDWDHDKGGRTQWVAWMTKVMGECYRVLKPGHWAIVWAIPRRQHWTAWAIEDAGFRLTDVMLHVFASGFPKGKGQLKPAYEPWILAKKPGPMVELNVDATRIGTGERPLVVSDRRTGNVTYGDGLQGSKAIGDTTLGRWPPNLLLSDPELFDEPNPYVVGSGATDAGGGYGVRGNGDRTAEWGMGGHGEQVGYGDTGGYSRFFLIPKAARSDREPLLLPDGHDRMKRFSTHPTMKPTDLMRHLVRLVTPIGGTVLDCFAGSGTTLIAAEMEGFAWIGIEKEAEYLEIAKARLNGVQRGLGLDVPA